MEYKVGDKVVCVAEGMHTYLTVGRKYVVKDTLMGGNKIIIINDNEEYFGYPIELFNQAQPDLRDLLKVGYKVKTTVTEAIIKNQFALEVMKKHYNENLNLRDSSIGLTEIYRPKYNGIKPMEWELVWKRNNPKYYLRSWIEGDGHVLDNVSEGEENYLNFETDDNFLFIADCEDFDFNKTQFTQEEIDNLPNQDFIKTLVKEEVE